MKIIDSKKDYYDYLQGILGMDEKVTYDRRGSKVILPSEFYNFDSPFPYDLCFSKLPYKCDRKRVKKTIWQSCKYENRIDRHSWSWKKSGDSYEGTIYHLFLEVGFHQYIFEIERYLDEDNKLKTDVSIVEKKTVGKGDKKSEAPLYIAEYQFGYSVVGKNSNGMENPILKETWIPRFIPAQDMWNMLYEYISSLNDKEFTDSRTNDQHIESHGFDKKISFRHRK